MKIPAFGAGNATGPLLKPLGGQGVPVTLTLTRDHPADGALDAVGELAGARG